MELVTSELVTIPMWLCRDHALYQLSVTASGCAWHFCTNNRPRREPLGRMHFVHQGELIGSLPVLDVATLDGPMQLRRADGFRFRTDRKYAIRARLGSGMFREQEPVVHIRGFRGWRYWNHKCPDCSGLGCVLDGSEPGDMCQTCNGRGEV